MYRYFLFAFAAIALGNGINNAGAATEAVGTNRYAITGDLSAAYTNGEFVVWESKKSSSGSGGMAAASSMSGAGGSQSSLKDGLNIVAEAPIVDGKFFLEGTVDAAQRVNFYVLNATGKDGHPLWAIKGQSFILEPGELTLVMDSRAKFVVHGGRYNDIVVNSWRLSPEFLESMENHRRMSRPVAGETENQRRSRVDKASEMYSEMLRLETRGRSRVALNHEDPIARKLTLQTAWLWNASMTQAVRELAKLMPDDPWVMERLASAEASAASRRKEPAMTEGGQIKDFEAETLDGQVVSLSGALEGKQIMLLDFWASWCGPCRAEFPHIQQAYAEYGPRGFEVFSFSVDDEREDWVEASEEEDLPWIDSGMGWEHPATEAYGITGVPASFLVDAATGEIVARDLRGHKLDEALKERLGEAGDD